VNKITFIAVVVGGLLGYGLSLISQKTGAT
jgi:hypothetical protein